MLPGGFGSPDFWGPFWGPGSPGIGLPPDQPPIVPPAGGITARSTIPMFTRIDDHGERAGALLVEQFKA